MCMLLQLFLLLPQYEHPFCFFQAGAGGDIPAGTGRGRGKKGVPSPVPGIGGSFNLTAGMISSYYVCMLAFL